MLARAYSIKIGVIFGVRFERRKVDKKQTYMKTEICKLYSTVFEYFCHMSSKSILFILIYTVSKLVHFLRHSVFTSTSVSLKYQHTNHITSRFYHCLSSPF